MFMTHIMRCSYDQQAARHVPVGAYVRDVQVAGYLHHSHAAGRCISLRKWETQLRGQAHVR